VVLFRRPETADRELELVVLHIRTTGRAEGLTVDVDQAICAVVVAAVRVVLARLRAAVVARVVPVDRVPSVEWQPRMRVAVVVAVDRVERVHLTPRAVLPVLAVVALGELQRGVLAPPQLAQQERTVSAAVAAGLVTVTRPTNKVLVAMVARASSSCDTRCQRSALQTLLLRPTAVHRAPTTSPRAPRLFSLVLLPSARTCSCRLRSPTKPAARPRSTATPALLARRTLYLVSGYARLQLSVRIVTSCGPWRPRTWMARQKRNTHRP